jgi:phosphoglycerate dehydrogenase-like enzyme
LLGPGGPRWIANGGAGTDHLGRWDSARTIVTNAAGVAADMMAEYVIGGFLHFTLDIPGLQSDKARRVWSAARQVRPLRGKTLLIIGLGHTGRAIAARAKAFGMTVIGTRARPEAMENVDHVHAAAELAYLFPAADFIAVSTPLTPATRGLVDVTAFAAMKRGVILADVSRGSVVVQAALLRALEAGTVAGAILDVFEQEPLPEANPLWDMGNVIISPHCSSVHDGWEGASFDLFLGNLQRWMQGDALVNVVDPDRGY